MLNPKLLSPSEDYICCRAIFKKCAPLVRLGLWKSKAQTLYSQSLITGTYSTKPKWLALAGCEGDSGHELSQGSNYHCQKAEVCTHFPSDCQGCLKHTTTLSFHLSRYTDLILCFDSFPFFFIFIFRSVSICLPG